MVMLRNNAVKQKSPLIVELVGPAGAGKTTLSRALSQRDEKIWVATDLQLRRREHIPIFTRNAALLLPVFLRQYRSSRWFTWDEMKAIVYLKAWPRVLRQQATNNGTAIVLDHGPVFKLATLLAYGPESLRTQRFEKWWNKMSKQWAFTLDMVIWLDAPDALLMKRINTRSQRHVVKGNSEREVHEFLARYRIAYKQVLMRLRAYRQLTVLEFDTKIASSEQIVDQVLPFAKEETPHFCLALGSPGWQVAGSKPR